MAEVEYMFIDGGNLRAVLRKASERYARGEPLELEWARVSGSARKTYYYDAIPVQAAGEDANSYAERTAAKREEIARMERQAGYHVRTGELKPRSASRGGSQQKMVDVQFAVEALSMAARGLFTRCALVIGDLDFKPLVEALVDTGVDVRIYYPKGETNPQLIAAADVGTPLSIQLIWHWLKPDWAAKHPLPIGGPTSGLDLGLLTRAVLTEKEDEDYGIVRLYGNDGGTWQIATDRCPGADGQRLHLQAADLKVLLAFAEDTYGLVVPQVDEMT